MRSFGYRLIIFFCLLSGSLSAQQNIKASFNYGDGKIFIYYEFEGDKESEYEVKVTLKRKSVPSFSLIPINLTGDAGKGKFAGGKRSAVWLLTDKETAMLDGDDFYFEITADEIKKGSSWYYYAGAAILAGGAAVFFLGSKKTNEETAPEVKLANPPGRP